MTMIDLTVKDLKKNILSNYKKATDFQMEKLIDGLIYMVKLDAVQECEEKIRSIQAGSCYSVSFKG